MNKLAVLILTMFVACASNPVGRRIGETIDKGCGDSAPCKLRIAELTEFEWDQIYVFEYNAELYDIQKALGTDFPNFVQFKRRLVFVKDGKIVHREDQPTDIERHVDREVLFEIPDAEVYVVYTPDTAVFCARKKTFARGVYYELTTCEGTVAGMTLNPEEPLGYPQSGGVLPVAQTVQQ